MRKSKKEKKHKDYMRLSKFEFDILDITLKRHPEPISPIELSLELRERGHDITVDELKKYLLE